MSTTRTDRRAAALIGVLYILGNITLILSAIVTAGMLDGPDSLARIAADPHLVAIGALLVIVAGIALGLVPVVFWPIGRRHGEALAMGYVVFRGAIETTVYLLGALGWLVLIALSADPGATPVASFVGTVNVVLWTQAGVIPFVLGAALFSALLFRSRLVPRWLAAWGLVGAALYAVPAIGAMVGVSLGVLMAPLAIQEMVLAAWLIAKGFTHVRASAAPREVGTPAVAGSPA